MDPAPALYAIRIEGQLGATLLAAFPAMTARRDGADTVLTGLLDRSALFGLLAEIEALSLDLLEIRQLTPPHERTSRRVLEMSISDSTVAIIGTGNIGGILAADFAAGGQDFLLAGRDQAAAEKVASGLGGHAEVVSVDEAVDRAGVLVLALWLDDFRQLIARYGGRLAGKVIVDPSNPVGPDGAGGYKKVIGDSESSGLILAGLLPAGARLVKAFGTLSAPTLSAAARREPERAVLFYAADDDAAGDLVAGLIRVGGYEPVRVGGLDQAIRIEMYGDLHEYGALGRVVTRTEALAAI